MYIFDSTKNNINDLNNAMDKNTTVIFFISSTCDYCIKLEPTIDQLISKFQNSKLNGNIARVYKDKIPQLKKKKDISGYPTISVYKNGEYLPDYTGQRDERSMSNFLFNVFMENKKKGLTKGRKIIKRISNATKKLKQNKKIKGLSPENIIKKMVKKFNTIKRKKAKKAKAKKAKAKKAKAKKAKKTKKMSVRFSPIRQSRLPSISPRPSRSPSRPRIRSPPRPRIRSPLRPRIRSPLRPRIRSPLRPRIRSPLRHSRSSISNVQNPLKYY